MVGEKDAIKISLGSSTQIVHNGAVPFPKSIQTLSVVISQTIYCNDYLHNSHIALSVTNSLEDISLKDIRGYGLYSSISIHCFV